MRKRGWVLLIIIAALSLAGWGSWTLLRPVRVDHGGRWSTPYTLKTLATAEVDFRLNDRDKNGKLDYWREDVAGLFGLVPKGGQEPIKLIEVSVAGADDRPVVNISNYVGRSPKAGYWFRTIRHANEESPNPNRFAFCAYPAEYGKTGEFVFIVDEEIAIFKKDLHRAGGIEIYPLDPIKEGWTRLE
jgi:hypothetical protein